MFLLVGLGNPGSQYENTRHNVGFRVIDQFAEQHGLGMRKIKFLSHYGEGTISGQRIVLLKPLTYMNRSGEAIIQAIQFFKLDPQQMILVFDDIDIPLGTIRIKKKGSAGSHNGLKSIIEHLHRDDFPRIKIGIGPRPKDFDLADYVLSPFGKEQQVTIEKQIQIASEACETILSQGLDQAMNIYNKKVENHLS